MICYAIIGAVEVLVKINFSVDLRVEFVADYQIRNVSLYGICLV